jgi:ribosomal protein S16
MTRIGRRHRPFFRINAVESRTPRDGKILEKLGHYDPIEKDLAKQIVLDRERTEYWLSKGAIPSDTVSQILLRAGLKHKYAEDQAARRAKARAIAGAKGKLFNKAQKIAAQKQAEAAEEKTKAEAEAKAKEAEEKAKVEAEAKEKAEAQVKAKAEAEAKAKAEEEKAKAEADAKAKAEAQAQAKPEPEAKPEAVEEKTEAEAQAQPEPEAKPEAETTEPVEEKTEAEAKEE